MACTASRVPALRVSGAPAAPRSPLLPRPRARPRRRLSRRSRARAASRGEAHPPRTGAPPLPISSAVTSFVKDGRDILFVRPTPSSTSLSPSPAASSLLAPARPRRPPDARLRPQRHWVLVDTTEGDFSIEMTLTPSDYTQEMWDKDFKVTQTITLGDGKLTATMKVTNPARRRFLTASSTPTSRSLSTPSRCPA